MNSSYSYRKIIITSGPTREWIDPVRYISNASSGLMGYSIAEECNHLTNNIVYIAGGTDPEYRMIDRGKNISVHTTVEMLTAVLQEIEEDSVLIMCAAPADYRPLHPSEKKIKKPSNETNSTITLELTENPDILKTVAGHITEKGWKNVRRIGFSAETDDLKNNAKGKLLKKDLDWILGNSVGRGIGFGSVSNTLHCYSRFGEELILGPANKPQLASMLMDRILLDLIRI